MSNVGIHSIGVYLPEEVRRNDYWPQALVDGWRTKRQKLPSFKEIVSTDAAPSSSEAAVLSAIAEYADDPFQGAVERRVAPDSMTASEMEVRAARDAIERAGIAADDIDFVLSHSSFSDYHMAPNACAVKEALGLKQRTLSMAVEVACNSFAPQLELAESLIASGRYRKGLLVQSALGSRVVPNQQPGSALFGDAATAQVVGSVAPGYGILGRAHYSDGTHFRSVVSGVPGHRWYDEGRVVMYVEDPKLARETFLFIGERSRQAIHAALADASVTTDQVSFYACHQPTRWIRKFTQASAGLEHARTIDTFELTTSIFSAGVPLVLAMAEREGTVKSGDVVATFAGGLGFTWSSAIMKWGRA